MTAPANAAKACPNGSPKPPIQMCKSDAAQKKPEPKKPAFSHGSPQSQLKQAVSGSKPKAPPAPAGKKSADVVFTTPLQVTGSRTQTPAQKAARDKAASAVVKEFGGMPALLKKLNAEPAKVAKANPEKKQPVRSDPPTARAGSVPKK